MLNYANYANTLFTFPTNNSIKISNTNILMYLIRYGEFQKARALFITINPIKKILGYEPANHSVCMWCDFGGTRPGDRGISKQFLLFLTEKYISPLRTSMRMTCYSSIV